MSKELINIDNIYTNVDVDNFEDLIYKLSLKLIETGDVLEEFPNEVIKRDKVFPTGLPTNPFGVAIPHTDAVFTNNNRLVIATLKKDMPFKVMGSENDSVNVRVVFLLALSESNKQLNVLKNVISVISNRELLEKIIVGNEKEIYDVIHSYF